MTNINVEDPNADGVFKIAFVIDDEVVDVIACDSRLAAIFLSDPTVVDVSEMKEQVDLMGMNFDKETGAFSRKCC